MFDIKLAIWTDFFDNLAILNKSFKIPHEKFRQGSIVFEKSGNVFEKLSSNYHRV